MNVRCFSDVWYSTGTEKKLRWINSFTSQTTMLKYFGWFGFNVKCNHKNHPFSQRLIGFGTSWNVIARRAYKKAHLPRIFSTKITECDMDKIKRRKKYMFASGHWSLYSQVKTIKITGGSWDSTLKLRQISDNGSSVKFTFKRTSYTYNIFERPCFFSPRCWCC